MWATVVYLKYVLSRVNEDCGEYDCLDVQRSGAIERDVD